MKLVKYLSILVLTLFVVSCSDDPDMGDKQEPNEDMISDYIKIKSNDLQGWDYGFINGKYIHTFVKKSEASDTTYVYFASKTNEDNLTFVIINDTIRTVLVKNNCYHIDYDKSGNNMFVTSFSDEGYINTSSIAIDTKSVPKKINSRADVMSGYNFLLTIRDWWGYMQTASDLNQDFNNQLWGDFFTDLGAAVAEGVIGHILGDAIGAAGALALAPFEMVAGTIQQSIERNAAKIYGDASIEISDIRKGTDGNIEIYVTIHNANTIPEYLFRYYEPEKNEVTRNHVYCGVIGRDNGQPTYHTHSPKLESQEVEIPTDGSVSELYLMFNIPSVGNGRTIKLRPYLKSTRIKNIFGNVDEWFIRYGNTIDYTDINGTILSVKKVDAIAGRDDSNMTFVHFTYDIKASVESLDNIEEWGIYILNADGSRLEYPSEYKAAYKENTIRVDDQNFNYNEFDELNTSSYYAAKKLNIGVYYKMSNPQGVYDYQSCYYGTPQEYLFEYDVKPSLTMINPIITGTEIIGTETENGKTIYHYQTFCNLVCVLKGSFWIDYIDLGISGGGWSYSKNNPWRPSCDMEWQTSCNPHYYSTTKDCNFSTWRNLHLFSGKIIQSNYLNFLGSNGNIVGVSTSSSPMYVNNNNRRQSSSNNKIHNVVIIQDKY